MSEKSAVDIQGLQKVFETDNGSVVALENVSLSVAPGEFVSIIGPSGCGKTTMIRIVGDLDTASGGDILVNQKTPLASRKARDVGFVFQSFHLMPKLSALDNVMLPLEISGSDDAQSKAKEALIKVGLEKRVQHFPTQLSGGEKQRVAIARAMVNKPKILFADEPTGNLDKKSSSAITDLLFSVNEQMQTTLVLVTHDLVLAEKCEKIYELSEGRLL